MRAKIVTISYDWQSDPCVAQWKIKLAKKSAKKSTRKTLKKSTWKSCVYWFEPFLDFHKKTPTELIVESKQNPDLGEDRLDNFYDYALDVLHRNIGSAIVGTYGSIQGFYSHNDISTKTWESPIVPPSLVQAVDANFPFFIEDEKSGEVKFDVEKYSNFLEYLNYRDQLFAKCLKDSSLDSGDLAKITLYTLRSQSQHKEIFLSGIRNKTGRPFETFFSKENTRDLRKYDKSDRFDADDSEPIFVEVLSNRKKRFKQKHHHDFRNDGMDVLPKGKPINVGVVSTNFRNAQERMGIPLVKGQQGPYRPKRNRSLFDDGCTFAGVPENIKKIMMGKPDGSSNSYPNKSRQQLLIHYKKFEKLVTLDRSLIELGELEKTEKQLQSERDSNQAMKKEMNDKIKELEIKTQEQMESMSERMESAFSLIRSTDVIEKAKEKLKSEIPDLILDTFEVGKKEIQKKTK